MYITNVAVALINRRTDFLALKNWDIPCGPSTMIARIPLNAAQSW